MVNIKKLRAAMLETDISIEELASKMNVDKSTIYRKFADNGQSITLREADLIKSTLGLSVEEASSIFFAHDVAKTQQYEKEGE